jgi:hypothetical protein
MYIELFRYCHENLEIDAASLMCDFEKAERKAAQKIFAGIVVNGCYFHFCQSLYRKARQLLGQLMSRKNGHQQAKHIVKMFERLGLLPREDVLEGLEVIKDVIREKNLTNSFKPFYKYVYEKVI